MQSYPFFLKPDQHQLATFHKHLNKWMLIAAIVVLTVNEVLIRPNLSNITKSLPELLSILALTLNAQAPVTRSAEFSIFMILISACYVISFSLLPKWGKVEKKAAMKKGLPEYGEYESAIFLIETTLQNFAFKFWHRFLMRISLLFGILVPTAVISLFRSI